MIDDQPAPRRAERLRTLLADPSSEVRLNAALAAGTHAAPEFVDALVDRCRIEPDFFVRDTLTWALVLHPRERVLARLERELWRAEEQARSQALHTLSKIGDPHTWRLITPDMLHADDDEVARTAWRAASVLVPLDERSSLAEELVAALGRGEVRLQRSLSRALAELGEAALPAIAHAEKTGGAAVRAHAEVTRRLIADPDLDLEVALEVAHAVVANDLLDGR